MTRTEAGALLAYGKKPRKLPCVLSAEEVARLLNAARAGRDRVLPHLHSLQRIRVLHRQERLIPRRWRLSARRER